MSMEKLNILTAIVSSCVFLMFASKNGFDVSLIVVLALNLLSIILNVIVEVKEYAERKSK